MNYPVRLTPADEGGFVVTFRDVPEAITQGEDEADAMAMAQEALITAMDFYFEEKREVHSPSALKAGERFIALPPSLASKALLLNEMVRQEVTASELARRMGTIPQEINRIVDLRHTTKIDRIAQALSALGKRLDLSVA